MLYLSGVKRPDLPFLATPRTGSRPNPGQVWAADTGLFGKDSRYTDDRYLAWLDGLSRDGCLFATAPDVVGDADATLARSGPMFSLIRGLGYRVALVAQDGLTVDATPWDEFDALFIGGTTGWKLGPDAELLAREAKKRGMWVHMGRVNSLRRMRYAESIGCDSADGTVLKHDKSRPVHGWGPTVRNNPSLWRGYDQSRRTL